MTSRRSGRRSLPVALVPALLLALFLAWAPPATAQQPTAEPLEYVVQPGDTLSAIAERFGTSVQSIVAANGLENPRLIVAGQRLLIPADQPDVTPTPEPQVYIVQPGDTLTAIAERFGTTAEAIAAANGIVNPAMIAIGQKLLIPREAEQPSPQPGPTYRRFHTVRPRESLPFLAFRYGTTPWALGLVNRLGSLSLLHPGQELEIPPPTAPTASTPRLPQVIVSPSPVIQGQTLLVKVRAEGPAGIQASGQFLDQDLPFVPGDGDAWAIAGVDVMTKPGSYWLTMEITEGDTGDRITVEMAISVAEGSFSRYNVVVPPDRQGLLDPALSRAEREKVERVFARQTDRPLWEGPFGSPVAGEMIITAAFGQLRSYNGGPVASYHSGQDLRVDMGAPVYAPAAGTVVLAEQLQVRGYAVILDHGLGVLTGFWHLSQIQVEVGQQVERGTIVGLAGDTGLSTGPHLHWEMQVRGVPVDPLQWTQVAFP